MGLFNFASGVAMPDQKAVYADLNTAGGQNSSRWADLLKKGIPQRSDPFWQAQMDKARQQAMQAMGVQGDAYGLMQAIQAGGPTAAQGAIQQGTQTQMNALGSGAAGAAGGARGAAAAQGTAGLGALDASLQGDAALQGQQASDQLNATQMMQQLAGQMREGSQNDLNMFNQNAFDRAQNNLGWRGLNDQNSLDYGKMIQDEIFGKMGFQQDRTKLADDSWWARDAINRANQAGAIGAVGGAGAYIGRAANEGGGGTPTAQTPTSQTPDYINSDERVKEDVRKQAYQEGLADARQGYTGIEDLIKHGEGKPKPQLAALMAPPVQTRVNPTRELLGSLALPPPGSPPPKPAADPSTFPPEFQALLASLQHPATVGALQQPAPPLHQLMAPPPQFQGLMGALQAPQAVDPNVDRFTSDERSKTVVKSGDPSYPHPTPLDKTQRKNPYAGKEQSGAVRSEIVDKTVTKDPYAGKDDAGTVIQSISYTSDERQKTNIRDEADPFLDALARGRASYEYKSPELEPNPGKGGRSLGVMAQELERVPELGAQLVDDTPQGKMVNVKSLVSALAAGEGTLHDRYGDIEERVRRLEGGRRGR